MTQPAHGVTSVAADGLVVLYRPAPGFSGNDTFAYTAADPSGLEASAAVAVRVLASLCEPPPECSGHGTCGAGRLPPPPPPPPVRPSTPPVQLKSVMDGRRLAHAACIGDASIRVRTPLASCHHGKGPMIASRCVKQVQTSGGRAARAQPSQHTTRGPHACRCMCSPGWLGFACDVFFLSASPASGPVGERGVEHASISLALARRPSAPVTCLLAVTDGSEGAVDPDVTFDRGNWAAAQVRRQSISNSTSSPARFD